MNGHACCLCKLQKNDISCLVSYYPVNQVYGQISVKFCTEPVDFSTSLEAALASRKVFRRLKRLVNSFLLVRTDTATALVAQKLLDFPASASPQFRADPHTAARSAVPRMQRITCAGVALQHAQRLTSSYVTIYRLSFPQKHRYDRYVPWESSLHAMFGASIRDLRAAILASS